MGKVLLVFNLAKNFKVAPAFVNPPAMMRGRGFFGRMPRGGRGRGFRRGTFRPY